MVRLRRWLVLLLAVASVDTAGCGAKSDPPVPVVGIVQVQGKRLTLGWVTFYPDETTGNERTVTPIGEIKPDGTYQLSTNGVPGSPLGKYKVVVGATNDPIPARPPPPKNGKRWQPNWLHHEKYASPQTTDLRVEVVKEPAPGQYDLTLTK